MIDLTDLNDRHDRSGLDDLVTNALAHGVAAVCVWPEFVGEIDSRLRLLGHRQALHIATVVNFPSGEADVDDVRAETEAALVAGADEIDLVAPYRALAAGDLDAVRSMVSAIASAVHAVDGHLKVILETGELSDLDLIRTASRLAVESGADFIKSSTGKTITSATPEGVGAMVDVIAETGAPVGLKPSGGIRTVEDAGVYLDLVDRRLGPSWATPDRFRFGASSLLDDALDALVE